MFKKIAPDKWRHIYAGIAMGLVLQIIGFWQLQSHPYWSTFIALMIVIAISYGFELFSKITGMGVYDIMDAVASTVGGVIGMGIAWFMEWLF
jgi:glycopeptide antibiotics resistance protein